MQNQYLITLREAKSKASNSQARYSTIAPKIGTVVMVHDVEARKFWRMGVIRKLFTSEDGQVREAMVEVVLKNKYMGSKDRIRKIEKTLRLRKAICHLYPLELEVEKYEEDLLSQVPSETSQHSNASQNDDIPDASPFESSTPQEEDNSLIEEENLGPCAAEKCVKPIDTVLQWIECESCRFWFHLDCLKLSKTKDYSNTYFACNNCWGPKNAVDFDEVSSDPSVSEESQNEKPNEVHNERIIKTVNDGNLDNENNLDNLDGSQPNDMSAEDGGVNNSDPVVFEPEISNNIGAKEARTVRKAALDCRKLLQEKMKTGQIGK